MADMKLGQGGALGSAGAILADFVFNSGEFVVAVLGWLFGNADLLLPMFSTLRGQVAPRVAWLPTGTLDKLVFALAVLFLLITASKLVRRTFGRSD